MGLPEPLPRGRGRGEGRGGGGDPELAAPHSGDRAVPTLVSASYTLLPPSLPGTPRPALGGVVLGRLGFGGWGGTLS